MQNIVKGNLSFRPTISTYGTAYDVYPKGERSHWSRRASLYPASDGKSYVVTMSNGPLDARPSLDAAIDLVVERLQPQEPANYVGKVFTVTGR